MSPICLGTMNFGPKTDQPTSFAIMDRALEEGINFFDVADVYGNGDTESILGRWFAQGGERREKTVLATKVGSSNFAGWHLAQANEAARRRNFLGLVSEQSLYNLTERTVELEVVPAAAHYGLGILRGVRSAAASSLAFSGPGRREAWGRRRASEDRAPPTQLEIWEKPCADLGEQPSVVALGWLCSNPVVTAPIIGPRTTEQFVGSLRTLEISLTAEVLAKLDEIFPDLERLHQRPTRGSRGTDAAMELWRGQVSRL